MANYIIIGGDGKEYGPVTDADVRQWITEGRLAASSLAKGEGDAEFRPLSKFPELADSFLARPLSMAAVPSPIEPPKPPPSSTPAGAGSHVLPEDYELDIIGCLTRGWELVKENFGTLFVGSLIYWGIQFGVSLFGKIPFVGVLFSLANFVCAGPLMAGLYYLFIRVNRGEKAEVGEVFAGFRRGFGQLFLAAFVQSLIAGICFLPVLILFGVKFITLWPQLTAMQPGSPPDPAVIESLIALVLAALPLALLCSIPTLILSVAWKFSLPLIIDRQLDFITAMKTSWRMVFKHWFVVFGLVVLVSVLNLVGLLCCCVGILFTFPISLAALMIAYETIFCAAKK
jgi:uncharacterized membrane protein